jgi:protoporphyrinogen oxidase
MEKTKEYAVIIGAGPGGLTAAYELLKNTDITPIVLEESEYVGGISRTVVYKGNRIDIGGHRFFSKSDRVMDWWLNILPIEKGRSTEVQKISYRGKSKLVSTDSAGTDPEKTDRVMLVRNRKSRIYFNKNFFDYPVSLSIDTLRKFGLVMTIKMGLSYVRAMLFPYKEPKNLEEFYINQFGRELYETFFKSYTEKVWGVPCKEISAEWGSQRVKGLSLVKAVKHFVQKTLMPKSARRNIETSLIENFFYPKLGPGQMWEEVTKDVLKMGGEVRMHHKVIGINASENKVNEVVVLNTETNEQETLQADYVFSTMPIKELVVDLKTEVPKDVMFTATHLEYRDFITVGLLLKKMTAVEPDGSPIKDNWIYVQEPWVKVGRIQIFNNWSPYLVAQKDTVWIGLEYFCKEGDELWNMSEKDMIALGTKEMSEMGLIDPKDVLDATVIRMKKTYPGYFGEYKNFEVVRGFFDRFENLFLIGRNGMHKYNNQDHSMLTAMTAVDNISKGIKDKSNIWSINAEEDYHEETSKK